MQVNSKKGNVVITSKETIFNVVSGSTIDYKVTPKNLSSNSIKVYVNGKYIKTIKAYNLHEVILYSEKIYSSKVTSIYIVNGWKKSNTIKYIVNTILQTTTTTNIPITTTTTVAPDNSPYKDYRIKNIYEGKECSTQLQNEFNKAIVGGYNRVLFEEGIYYVRNLSLKSNIVFEGLGNVVIKSHSSCSPELWDCAVINKNVDNVTIKNLEFDGNKSRVLGNTEQGVTNLRFENSTNIIIDGCKFYNNYYLSTLWYGCDTVEVKNSSFKSSDASLLFMRQASSNIKIHDNTIDGIDGTSEGISFYDCYDKYHTNIQIYNNIITNKTWSHGIYLIQTDTSNIYNNIIDKCGNGFYISRYREDSSVKDCNTNLKIYKNIISNSTWDGFYIEYCTNSEIYENSIINAASQNVNKQSNLINVNIHDNIIK